jgi:hypothetical protein
MDPDTDSALEPRRGYRYESLEETVMEIRSHTKKDTHLNGI